MTIDNIEKEIGNKIYKLAEKLWPINRSITGKGLRKTLNLLGDICPKISINEIKSGKKVFDWKIPKEWNVSEAWIKNSNGEKIIDFKKKIPFSPQGKENLSNLARGHSKLIQEMKSYLL